MTTTATTTTTTTTAVSKYAVDMALFPKYKVCEDGALGLSSVNGEEYIEFGFIAPKSGVVFARVVGDGMYFGHIGMNPMVVDDKGEMLERFANGTTLESIVSLLASKTTTHHNCRPREEWNAGFKRLPQFEAGMMCIRVYITTPYATPYAVTLQDEIVMHRFG